MAGRPTSSSSPWPWPARCSSAVSDIDPAEALADGRAMDAWRAMISAQGGDPDAPLPRAAHTHLVLAESDGVLTRLDAYAVGIAAWRLGAGRARQQDPVSAGAGVVMLAKPGDPVRAGHPLFELHTDEPARFDRALEALDGGYDIGPGPAALSPLIIGRVS